MNPLKKKMHIIAKNAVDAFSSPGVFAVELFLSGNEIYVNELSPRPHNSGHHTIEANETSQFKQLLYILLKSCLEPTTLLSPSLMFNLLGPKEYTGSYKLNVKDPNNVPLNMSLKYPGIHIYGKNPSKPYRKLGHVTILEQDYNLLKEKYELYKKILKIVPTESKTTQQVSIIMGSISDHPVMNEATKILQEFGVTYEVHIISAHRTPDRMYSYAKEAQKRGIEIIIAGAGGAAHLPGMTASLTNLPVIGVPIKTSTLSGIDSLYSIVQMPGGVPVATMAINGAKNAGLMAVKILALKDSGLQSKLDKYNKKMYDTVMEMEENLNQEDQCNSLSS